MFRLSIKVKIIVLVLIVALPLFGVSIYHDMGDLRRARSDAEEWILHQAHMVSAEVDTFLNGSERLLIALSEIPEVKNQEWGKCSAIFSRLMPEYRYYENILVIDSKGWIYCSAVPQVKPTYAGDRTYFKKLMETGRFTIGEVQIGRITGKPVVVLAYPLRDSTGKQAGMVGASISLLRIQEIFKHLSLKRNEVVTLVDRKGRVVASNLEPETPAIKDVSGETWFREVIKRESGIFEIRYSDTERLISFFPSARSGWYATVSIPSEEIYSPRWNEIHRNMIFRLLVLVSALAISWLFGNRIVSPLLRLARGAKEMGAGRLGVRVEVRTGDEIEEMAGCFNQMSVEIKAREQALQEGEERFRSLVQSATDGIISADSSGKVISWNSGAENIFGYKEEEIIFKPLTILMPEHYREAHKKGLERMHSTGESRISGKIIELSGLRKDGNEFPLELSLSTLKVRGETFCTAIVRDISERIRAEEVLKESEKRYRHLIESVTDYIYTVQVEDGKAVATSHGPGCVAVTGYKAEEFETDPHLWIQMVYEEDRKAVVEQAEKALSGGAVPPLEHRIIHKDGKLRWVKNTVVPHHDEHGPLISYDGLIKDITEIKKLEEQLRHVQKMEAIGQLAGGIAHDFNNILNAILGFGNLIRDKMKKDDPNMPYLEEVIDAGERATHLTRSLLTFSRKQVSDIKPADVNDIVSGIGKMLSRIIGEDIKLRISLSEKELIVMADHGQIVQVLMNLATNARDAMPDGGVLTIMAEQIGLDREFIKAHGYGNPGEYALISVTDTGKGMSEATREKIFEPFFTTKEMGKGTGLGLAIVYGIVKQHNGYINVYSEPGMGTTFKIYLPLVMREAGEKERAALPAPKGGTETILVAEDDAAMRRLIKDVLERFGYTVIIAEDGEDAINKFTELKERIALVILDMIMPRKSGKEAYESIKGVRPDVRTIFLSGYTDDSILKKGMPDEEVVFLLKPVSPNDLLRKVREVLDR